MRSTELWPRFVELVGGIGGMILAMIARVSLNPEAAVATFESNRAGVCRRCCWRLCHEVLLVPFSGGVRGVGVALVCGVWAVFCGVTQVFYSGRGRRRQACWRRRPGRR